MSSDEFLKANKWSIKLTCSAYPEQYDVFDSEGAEIGYLRLRHGVFRVDYPTCGDETIYEAYPNGDGSFEDSERDGYIFAALMAIKAEIEKNEVLK